MTNENHYISTTKVPTVTKLGKMVTYFDGLLTLKVAKDSDHVLFHVGSWDKLKLLNIHCHKPYGYQTWKDGEIP